MSIYESYLPNYDIFQLPYLDPDDIANIDASNESIGDTLSTILSNFYNKITFMDDLLNNLVKLDFVYQKKLKEQFTNFQSFYFTLNSQEKKKANELFIYTTSDKAPNIGDFISIMKTFNLISNDIYNIANQCLNTTSVIDVPTLDDLFLTSDISQYEVAGLEIDDPYIEFKLPFKTNPVDTYLKELKYTSLEDIRNINKTYEYEVFIPLNKLLRIKNTLLKMYAQLKTELSSINNQNDPDDIKIHFKAVLFTATVVCNITGKLIALNRAIMYKIKLLLDIASKCVLTVIKQRD